MKAVTPSNITAGYQVAGIWPFDRNVFNDDNFLCSSVTDLPARSTVVDHEIGSMMRQSMDEQQNVIGND
jgi:hypothetical protein